MAKSEIICVILALDNRAQSGIRKLQPGDLPKVQDGNLPTLRVYLTQPVRIETNGFDLTMEGKQQAIHLALEIEHSHST